MLSSQNASFSVLLWLFSPIWILLIINCISVLLGLRESTSKENICFCKQCTLYVFRRRCHLILCKLWMGQASHCMTASHQMVPVLATEQQHKLRIMNCEKKTCYLTFSVIYLLCLIQPCYQKICFWTGRFSCSCCHLMKVQ